MNINNRIKKDIKFATLLMLILGLLLILLFVIFIGFTIWFWFSFILWLLFLFIFYLKIIKLFKVTDLLVWISFGLVVIITIIFMIPGGATKSSKTASGTTKKLSAEECKPYIAKYDGKILKITGEGLVGQVAIKIDPNACRIKAYYVATFTSNIAQNPDTSFFGSPPYNYIIRMHKPSDTSRGNNDYGALSPVYANAGVLPAPYTESQVLSEFYRPEGTPDGPTSNFYWHYNIDTNFSEARYQQIFTDNVFEVVDGLPFIEVTDHGDGVKGYSINHDRAEKEGKIIKTIDLTISE